MHSQSFSLPRAPTAARLARAHINALPGLSEDLRTRIQLAISEVVNNAILHGEGDITLTVERHEDRLRFEVVDEGTDPARTVRPREPDDSGGRGLHIVAGIADAWGVYDGTTHVWCDFALP